MSCSVKSRADAEPAQGGVGQRRGRAPRRDISREAQNHPAPTPIAAWTAAARALAVRELLLQEARRIVVDAEPLTDGEGRTETAEEASIRALVEREVSTPIPDEAACRRYYQQNLKRFRSADLYEAAHILIAARPGDRAAYAAARTEAEAVDGRLARRPRAVRRIGPGAFGMPLEGAVGGNLGQLSPGGHAPEFDAALGAIGPGEMTPAPVASRFGHHIIRLDRKIEGRQLPFEQVRNGSPTTWSTGQGITAIAQFVARLPRARRSTESISRRPRISG